MQLTATRDFSASVDGVEIHLKKGEPFSGTKKAAEHLTGLGLIAKGTKKPAAKEGKEND